MLTALHVKTTLALESFKKDQRGVTAIEYAIVGVAMSAIVLAVFGTDTTSGLGKGLKDAVDLISTNIGKVKVPA